MNMSTQDYVCQIKSTVSTCNRTISMTNTGGLAEKDGYLDGFDGYLFSQAGRKALTGELAGNAGRSGAPISD